MNTYGNNIIYFAQTHEPREKSKLFGQYLKDKIFHSIITGATGTGKSNLLETMIVQEIEQNIGSVVVFDPNGDLVTTIIGNAPPSQRKNLVVIDPTDPNCQYGYNPLRKVNDTYAPLMISGVIETFRRLYGSSWGNRIENLLRYSLLLLAKKGHSTLDEIPKLLVDETFRYSCLRRTNDAYIHDFWSKEFPKYRADALLPVLSKFGAIINHPAIRRTIVEPKVDVSLRQMIDHKRVILVSLSKGRLGSDVSAFIGSILITSLLLAVYSRANVAEWARPRCSLYIDEFQNFTTTSLITAFAEVRKYNLAMTVATQRLSSLVPEIRDAVLGNIGTLITFRVSYDEARVLAKYLYPTFRAEDIVGLPNHYVFLVMMIHGRVSIPFSAKTVRYSEITRKMKR